MSKTLNYRTIKTTTGDTVHLAEIPGRNPVPHSINEAAWVHSDGKKEYYIYGLRHTKASWDSAITHYKRAKKSPKKDFE